MKKTSIVTALILAGGRGERFWPKSRKKSPKHLLELYGKGSLLNQTIERLKGVVKLENIWIITNRRQVTLIGECWNGVNILVEPEGRNTAAAIGLAAVRMKKVYGSEAVMLVLSTDHWIKNPKEFKTDLRRAIDLAGKGKGLVTIGIKPTRPETGFGYIEKGSVCPGFSRIFKVKKFIEKPGIKRAKKLYRNSRYLWNAGIFIWKVEEILQSFKKYLPVHFKGLSRIEKRFDKNRSFADVYCRFAKVSIDYGIMEKARDVRVIEGRFGWEDVGSWTAWAGLKKRDASGNVTAGKVVPIDTARSVICSDGPLVAALGVENLIIIADSDAILVCHKDRAQDIKKITAKLQQRKKWRKYL